MLGRASLVFAAALVAPALAHEAFFGPAAFSRDNNPWELAYPLDASSGDQSKWFFRGLRPESATGPAMQLKAGGTATLKIGCDPGVVDRSGTCPEDFGSLHSGDGKRTGCAIAISYKPFDQIKPSDMKVISVLDKCVEPNADHKFAVPSNLPATAKGKAATCAFLWVPSASSSADEMYMSGFNCEVSSSTPAGSSLADDNKAMIVFAVQGAPKVDGSRPAYNELFPNGAQKLNVKVSGSAAKVTATSAAKSTSSKSTSSKSSSRSDSSSSSTAAAKAANAKSAVKASAAKCKRKVRRSVDFRSPPAHVRREYQPRDGAPEVARRASSPHRRSRPIR